MDKTQTRNIMEDKINIGKLIKRKLNENGRKEQWLADKLHRHVGTVTRICQCEGINTDKLIPICSYLEYNFFNDYAEYINRQIRKESNLLFESSLYQFIGGEKIHIGKLIQEIKEKEGVKSSWLAKKIRRDKSDMPHIYNKKHIHTDILVHLCIYLNFNFFEIYANYVDEQLKKKRQTT